MPEYRAMHRITPERAKAAYQKAGVTPIRCKLWETDDRGRLVSACAVGAVFLAEVDPDGGDRTTLEAARLVGLNSIYASGFVKGFDDWPEYIEHPMDESRVLPEWNKGYADGRSVAREVGLGS